MRPNRLHPTRDPSDLRCRLTARGGGGRVLLLARPERRPHGWRWHWWIDGRYAGATSTARRHLDPGDEAVQVRCVASRRSAYDGQAREPLLRGDGRFDVEWAAVDGAAGYRLEWRVVGDPDWIVSQRVPHVSGQWSYAARTAPLPIDELVELQVVPFDALGIDGSALALGSRRVYRRAARPEFDVLSVVAGVVSLG